MKTKKPKKFKPQKIIWVLVNADGMMINYDTKKEALQDLTQMTAFIYGPFKYILGKD